MRGGRPLIAAVSDIHAPRHLEELEGLLESTPLAEADLFLLAGDLVHNDDHRWIPSVLGAITKRYSGPIYACPGNNEFDSSLERYRGYGGAVWLADEAAHLKVGGTRVTVIGTKGVRDVVTPWLVRGLTPNPDVEGTRKTYAWRERRLEGLLSEASGEVVVLSHFAPTYRTLVGEEPSSYGELGSARLERLIEKYGPKLWVHGHAHNSKRTHARIGRTSVYNVALPATHTITLIEL